MMLNRYYIDIKTIKWEAVELTKYEDKSMITEKKASTRSGYVMLLVLLVSQLLSLFILITAPPVIKIIALFAGALVFICWFGFFIVAPNHGKILQLFGKYVGTEHATGLRWANPFYFPKRAISLRIRNFESSKLKVNDASGNPIEIAAVVVWKVVDSAEAFFEVDDYESFVTIQSESALRNLAMESTVQKLMVKEGVLDALVNAPVSGGRDPTESLPDELIVMIVLMLPFATLWSGACRRVCRRWNRLMESAPIVRRKREGRWAAYESGVLKPQELEGHAGAVMALAVGLDDKIYSGSEDKTIRVWSGESGAHLQTLHGHTV